MSGQAQGPRTRTPAKPGAKQKPAGRKAGSRGSPGPKPLPRARGKDSGGLHPRLRAWGQRGREPAQAPSPRTTSRNTGRERGSSMPRRERRLRTKRELTRRGLRRQGRAPPYLPFPVAPTAQAAAAAAHPPAPLTRTSTSQPEATPHAAPPRLTGRPPSQSATNALLAQIFPGQPLVP